MGMSLTADDLREIATTVDKIKDAGLDVEVVQVRGHKVVLKRSDRQTNGMEYYIIGLTEGELSGPAGKVMREADEGRKPDMGHLPGRTPLGGSRRRDTGTGFGGR